MRTVDPGDAREMRGRCAGVARELQLAGPEGVRHAKLMWQARAGVGEQDESSLRLATR